MELDRADFDCVETVEELGGLVDVFVRVGQKSYLRYEIQDERKVHHDGQDTTGYRPQLRRVACAQQRVLVDLSEVDGHRCLELVYVL